MLKVTRWSRFEYHVGGETITMQLKTPTRAEMRPLQRQVLRIFEESEEAAKAAGGDPSKLTIGGQAKVLDKVFGLIPEDEIAGWFEKCVKEVDGLEVDGEPVTSGKGLYEYADDLLVFSVVMRLVDLARLSASEGKGSASPSTSSAAAGTTDGASPAPSTEREAGPTPSTVVPMRHAAS